MSAIEKLKFKFTSGNDVPVERSLVYKEEFDAVYAEFREVLHHRKVLIEAISATAVAANIVAEGAFLDGPMCLLVLDDIANDYKLDKTLDFIRV